MQLADNASAVSVASGGGDIQLFLSPGLTGLLRLRSCARVAARPGTVRQVETRDDGSLLFRLPLEQGDAAAVGRDRAAMPAAAAEGVSAAPRSRLQRAVDVQPQPPSGSDGTTGSRGQAGADIVLDAGERVPQMLGRGMIPGRQLGPIAMLLQLGFRAALCCCAGGSGTITLTHRGWMDALRQRWS